MDMVVSRAPSRRGLVNEQDIREECVPAFVESPWRQLATDMLSAVDTSSDPRVNVTTKRVVQGCTNYLYGNRAFETINALGDGGDCIAAGSGLRTRG